MLIMTKSSDENVEPVRIPGSTILRLRSACPGYTKITGDYEGKVKPAIFYAFLGFFMIIFQRVRRGNSASRKESFIFRIVVNGREFNTSSAANVINGEEVGVGDSKVLAYLNIGKVINVKGRISIDGTRATADRVVYNDNITGPVVSVSGIDPVTNEKEIAVLGQIVVVNYITKFKPDTLGFDSLQELCQQ